MTRKIPRTSNKIDSATEVQAEDFRYDVILDSIIIFYIRLMDISREIKKIPEGFVEPMAGVEPVTIRSE